MDSSSHSLSQDAYTDHMLAAVISATGLRGETAGARQIRAAAILKMFVAFETANAMETMVACHCITLQYLLSVAMFDASNIELDPVALGRARASAMSISKMLYLWMTRYEKMRGRNETRATAARKPLERPETAAPVAVKPRPEQPRPVAAQSPGPAITGAPRSAPFIPPGALVPPTPGAMAQTLKEALLSSSAILPDVVPAHRET
jgi:hypothetical protein